MAAYDDDLGGTTVDATTIQSVAGGGTGANMSATGGTGHVVKQASAGAAFTTGTVAVGDVADDAITNAKLRDSAGVSVIGRAANTTGDPADIIAAADGQFLSRAAGALSFRAPTAAEVTNTPAGTISGETVQAALNELDSEKAALAGATFTGDTFRTGAESGRLHILATATAASQFSADGHSFRHVRTSVPTVSLGADLNAANYSGSGTVDDISIYGFRYFVSSAAAGSVSSHRPYTTSA